MWCQTCGSLLSSSAGACPACGQAPHGAHGGAPCDAGRSLGGLRVTEEDVRQVIRGATPGGLVTKGEQRTFQVRGPGVEVWLGYVAWEDGEREVRRTRREAMPHGDDRLLGGRRLEIEAWADGVDVVELGRARRDPLVGVVIDDVSEYELDASARACVRCALRSLGACAMGTRQELQGVGDEHRHRLCAIFPSGACLVPVVAFALTRIVPLLHPLHV